MIMVGYGRVSTSSDEQIDSLEHQVNFFNDFAKIRNHTLYRIYSDEGISGKQLKNREQFKRMLRDAELHLFELVVVKDVSRFARNTVDLLTAVRKLKSLNVEVIFLSNNQKVLGESEFVLTLFGAMAQEESANLSKRVKFGKKITAKQGRVPIRVFGYDRVDNFHLTINEDEAAIVREIYNLYLNEGLGCRKIALELCERGYKTKLGCDWNSRGVRRVLENSIYCGRYINRKYEIADFIEGNLKKLPVEENILHLRPEWAIVSENVFNQTQIMLGERRKTYQNKYTHMSGRYSNRHLFSTLIKCEHCGRSFSRKSYTYTNTRVFWKCITNDQCTNKKCENNVTIDEDELKQNIGEYLTNLIGDKKSFKNELIEYYKDISSTNEKLTDHDKLQKYKDKLELQKERYQEMYAGDVISFEELESRVDRIKSQLDKINLQLSSVVVKESKNKTTSDIADCAIAEIERFTSLESPTNTDIRKIISSITVNKNHEITIYLKAQEDVLSLAE